MEPIENEFTIYCKLVYLCSSTFIYTCNTKTYTLNNTRTVAYMINYLLSNVYNDFGIYSKYKVELVEKNEAGVEINIQNSDSISIYEYIQAQEECRDNSITFYIRVIVT